MSRPFVLISALLLVVGVAASAGELETPADIVRVGQRLHCAALSRNAVGVNTTWVRESETPATAYAAWCKRQDAAAADYDLIVSARSPHAWSRCPAHIRMRVDKPFPYFRVRMLPRELPYAMTLTEFWYMGSEDYTEQGPPVRASGPPRGPALDVGYEDAGQLLLCFRGRWIAGGYH